MSSTAHVKTHLDVVEKLLSNGFNHLQVNKNYIFPPNERPQMEEVSHSYRIPVIDLKDLDGPARKSVVNEITGACEEDGFFQVLSNGRFQSIEHRAITNSTTARIAIPTFYGPSLDAFISPAESMVDEEHPPLYRGYTYAEYMEAFWSQGLKSKSIVDRFKIETGQ